MYQNYQYEVDPKDPLKPLFQGTFEKKVTVGGKERRYLVYIPRVRVLLRQACLSCRRMARPPMISGATAGGA